MFSIVIPVYKNYSDLFKAINSCKSNLIKEIIVVDDTPREFRKDFSMEIEGCDIFFIYNYFNRGVTFSRNTGYFKSTQPYIIFLDSDDTLIASNLLQAKKYIDGNGLDVAFFNTTTKGLKNSDQGVSIEGGWKLLFDMANSGERLVVVKNTRLKPFYGFLRGHELAGLFRVAKNNNFNLGWSALVLREYSNENTESLSQLRLTKERSALIALGHYSIASKLSFFKQFKLTTLYFLKGLYYDINSRFFT